VEERALKIRGKDEQSLNNSDRLILQHYKFKTKWVELNEEYLMGKYDEVINMEWKEQNSRINSARQTLPEDQQNIIQLVIVEGNSLRKAGKIVGVSAMTVQRRLKQALEQLRELLTADQSD
jgi:RNA polymerase sigma-B factor